MNTSNLSGQWIGPFVSEGRGKLVINFDRYKNFYIGRAFLCPENPVERPGVFANIVTSDLSTNFEVRIQAIPLDKDGEPTSINVIRNTHPHLYAMPEMVCAQFDLRDGRLETKWQTDIGTHATATLVRNDSAISRIDARTISWENFKEESISAEPGRYIYRGQEDIWRLRSSFHRAGRADVIRFQQEDMHVLHSRISSYFPYPIDLNIPEQNGAFLNLIRHHGYPTPSIDWSYSPFIAAYFAFQPAKNRSNVNRLSENVRIFRFDRKAWQGKLPQFGKLTGSNLHLSVREFLSIGNVRAVPQQALATITNIDDVEGWILEKSQECSSIFLNAFDININKRGDVIRELALMGITAGALMPGLDGICQELMERHF